MSAKDAFDDLVSGGWPLIEQWIATQRSESLHLDFKRRAPAPPTDELQPNDKSVLGKAMSGFANVDGGVLVFGLETNKAAKGDPNRLSADPTIQQGAHLIDAAAFKLALQKHYRDVTVPTVPGVAIQEIVDAHEGTRGVVAMLVPSSDAKPHRTAGHLSADVSHRYFMRTDTDTLPMPHEMIAALFGRVPPPKLSLVAKWNRASVSPTINFFLRNRGRGLARDAIVRFALLEPGSQNVDSILPRDVNRTPNGNFVVYAPHTFKLLYPGFDEVLGGASVRRSYHDRPCIVRLTGTIFCAEAGPVDFDEVVDFTTSDEAELPTPT